MLQKCFSSGFCYEEAHWDFLVDFSLPFGYDCFYLGTTSGSERFPVGDLDPFSIDSGVT